MTIVGDGAHHHVLTGDGGNGEDTETAIGVRLSGVRGTVGTLPLVASQALRHDARTCDRSIFGVHHLNVEACRGPGHGVDVDAAGEPRDVPLGVVALVVGEQVPIRKVGLDANAALRSRSQRGDRQVKPGGSTHEAMNATAVVHPHPADPQFFAGLAIDDPGRDGEQVGEAENRSALLEHVHTAGDRGTQEDAVLLRLQVPVEPG
ncbi:MAG: hypothetical protein ACYTDX_09845 [Planctomycetota bacterium]|jgi:hypothetical protein